VVIYREKKRDWRTGIEYPTVTWVFAEDVMTAVEDIDPDYILKGEVLSSIRGKDDKSERLHERIHEDLRI